MSAFTDRLHAFFSRFAEVSHEDLVKVEQAVEEKVQPLLTEVLDTAKADIARLEEQVKALEAKVEQLLGNTPAPAPAPAEPPAAS